MWGDYFSYYQKCNKKRCNFYQYFRIPLANYDDNGKCVLDKAHKRLYSFLCPSWKMVSFLNFETAANDACIIYLKRWQFVVKLRRQIKDKRTRWEERKRQRKCIIQINF